MALLKSVAVAYFLCAAAHGQTIDDEFVEIRSEIQAIRQDIQKLIFQVKQIDVELTSLRKDTAGGGLQKKYESKLQAVSLRVSQIESLLEDQDWHSTTHTKHPVQEQPSDRTAQEDDDEPYYDSSTDDDNDSFASANR